MMHAAEMLQAILAHTVDAPYTVETVYSKSPATVWITGHYNLDEGLVQDQLDVGLQTYFRVTQVITRVEPEADGWFMYSAYLTRRPPFAQMRF